LKLLKEEMGSIVSRLSFFLSSSKNNISYCQLYNDLRSIRFQVCTAIYHQSILQTLEKSSFEFAQQQCKFIANNKYQFAASFFILASDGLWDVITNDEAVEMVCGIFVEDIVSTLDMVELQEILENHYHGKLDWNRLLESTILWQFSTEAIYQQAARYLTLEALLRGSTDNIGVTVIDTSII
jgi:hypothetical protein